MKREKLRYNLKTKIIISVLAVFLASLMTIPVFAWMINKISFDYEGDFKGSSIIAYFAGGDGSPDDPYQITNPVHLYNLSWLQYLGIFNRDEDGDGKIDQQYYFVLENDINMSGLVIPPIGTDDNPFIGNFNGQGHCISNATVSNYVSKADGDGGVQQKPAAVEEIDSTVSDSSGKAIVGFFGVVGDWNYALDGKITDESELTIENKVNKVYDFRLDNLTIRTDTDESLIGLLAGYVNGSIVNVGIGESYIVAGENVTPLTGVTGIEMQLLISRYSLIGEYDHDTVVWPDEPILGGWGESLALETMYTDLRSIYNSAQNQEYISKETFTYRDGVQIDYEYETSSSNKLKEINLGSAGNYVFSTHSTSSDYTYLYGQSTWSKEVTKVYLTTRVGDYIYSGTNYLSLSSQNAVTSGTANNSVAWSTDDYGHLYTISNGTKYYLNRNDSSNVLTVSTNSSTATVWHRENVDAANGKIYCVVSGVNYYIYCDEGTWKVDTVHRTVTTETGYTIASGSNYLNLDSNGGLTSDTDPSTATLWTFSNTNSRSGTISAKVDNTTYYLYAQRTGWWNYTYTLSASTSDSTSWTNNSNVLSYTWEGDWFSDDVTRYLSYNNNAWGLSDRSTNLTITHTEREVVDEATEEDFNLSLSLNQTVEDRRSTTTTEKYTTETNATWFPLLTETNAENELTVSSSNTGYVVSGSDFQHTNAPQQSGNIRVSRYEKNSRDNEDISNSLSNGNLSHNIYSISYKNPSFATIGSAAQAVSKFGFQKYADVDDTLGSFSKLSNTLSGATYVYGLHFMDATIRMDNKITIDGAKVVTSKGLAYYETGYELPRNAITFNLPEAGYINFFAGTYFPGNTSFFSLYSIERSGDGKTITAIREIAEIYGVIDSSTELIDNSKEYVYRYTDGTYSDSLPSGYEVVFDTTWITAPTMHNSYVYYFEIPVNGGEFALGSVAGSDGAYLIYLDLAANGTRRVASEAAHEITGINFVDDAGLNMDTDIQDYPIVAFSIEMANGTTQHAGVTAGFDRQSATSMNQSLSGAGSASFTAIPIANNKVTITQTTSMAVDRISPQAFSLSRRRDEDISI